MGSFNGATLLFCLTFFVFNGRMKLVITMTNVEITDALLQQLEHDFKVDYNVFLNDGYQLFEAVPFSHEARNYYYDRPFCNLIYLGNGLVGIVDNKIRNFMEEYCNYNRHQLFRVFDAPQIFLLNKELEKHGYLIAHIAQYFLPDVNYTPSINNDLSVKLYTGEAISELYKYDDFPMALVGSTDAERRDVLALACFVNGEIVGVAGCSNDCDSMLQIGVDVKKEYRNLGIGSTLVYKLSQEILKMGKIPLYCCAYSNIASKATARRAGFKDAYVELSAKKQNEKWIEDIMNLRKGG